MNHSVASGYIAKHGLKLAQLSTSLLKLILVAGLRIHVWNLLGKDPLGKLKDKINWKISGMSNWGSVATLASPAHQLCLLNMTFRVYLMQPTEHAVWTRNNLKISIVRQHGASQLLEKMADYLCWCLVWWDQPCLPYCHEYCVQTQDQVQNMRAWVTLVLHTNKTSQGRGFVIFRN